MPQSRRQDTTQQTNVDVGDVTVGDVEVNVTTYEDAVNYGYIGERPDPNPPETYTVEGVLAAAREEASNE